MANFRNSNKMEHILLTGNYATKDVYRFYNVEDIKSHPKLGENWKYVVEDFAKYLGKEWQDFSDTFLMEILFIELIK